MQIILDRLNVARAFSHYLGHDKCDSDVGSVGQITNRIVSLSQEAGEEWGDVVVRYCNQARDDDDARLETRAEEDAEANLATILAGMRIDHDKQLAQDMNPHALHVCSYCGLRSARMRKCSGCGQAQ